MENLEVKEYIYRYCDANGNLDDSLNYHSLFPKSKYYGIDKLNDAYFKICSAYFNTQFVCDINFNFLFKDYNLKDVKYIGDTSTGPYDFYEIRFYDKERGHEVFNLIKENGDKILPKDFGYINIKPLYYFKNIIIAGDSYENKFLYDIENKEKISNDYYDIEGCPINGEFIFLIEEKYINDTYHTFMNNEGNLFTEPYYYTYHGFDYRIYKKIESGIFERIETEMIENWIDAYNKCVELKNNDDKSNGR